MTPSSFTTTDTHDEHDRARANHVLRLPRQPSQQGDTPLGVGRGARLYTGSVQRGRRQGAGGDRRAGGRGAVFAGLLEVRARLARMKLLLAAIILALTATTASASTLEWHSAKRLTG